MQHVTVYREPGRYAGWPANYGIWSWGDEIVVGFTVGYHKADAGFHSRDRDRPFVPMQARSNDGGCTWEVTGMPCRTPYGNGISADEHVNPDLRIGTGSTDEDPSPDCPGGLDFSHPDFALMCARTGVRLGARSWLYTSCDRCRTWQGPFRLPAFGQGGIAARTDYLASGPDTCTLFLTAAKSDGGEGHAFCAHTSDGGRAFSFLSWIGPEPEGFTIMPASVRLPDGRILAALRCRKREDGTEAERNWIDLYASDDGGRTWEYVNRPVSNTGIGGNPPAMIRLRDGRVCLTYGFRDAPHGIRARLSGDDGRTWGNEILLRDDGGDHDIGYPRTVQRSDGRVVTVYYFDDHPDTERYIAATIWEAP